MAPCPPRVASAVTLQDTVSGVCVCVWGGGGGGGVREGGGERGGGGEGGGEGGRGGGGSGERKGRVMEGEVVGEERREGRRGQSKGRQPPSLPLPPSSPWSCHGGEVDRLVIDVCVFSVFIGHSSFLAWTLSLSLSPSLSLSLSFIPSTSFLFPTYHLCIGFHSVSQR